MSSDLSGSDSPGAAYHAMSQSPTGAMHDERKDKDEHTIPAAAANHSAAARASPQLHGRMPEASVSHVNFHSADEDDEDHDEQARLSPKPGRSSSSDYPQRGDSVSQPMPPYPIPQAAGAGAHMQPASGSSAPVADHIASDVSGPAVVIAFINFHSGGKTGKSMAAELIHVLGKDNVFDLQGDRGPQKGLLRFKGTPNLRVVIGGGDGSINWVLSGMRVLGMTDVPAGCIPLGTGNDSSRGFGWGFKFPGVRKVKESVERMRQTRVEHFVKYDRWHALAQYDQNVSPEFADALPASLKAIRSEADIPEFYRHPKAIALPPVPDAKQLAASAKAQHDHARPLPHRAVTIDRDARDEGYNVQAIPLQERGVVTEHKHDAEPVPLERAAMSPANGAGEQGPGMCFGGEFNNYLMGLFGAWNFCACQSNQLDVSVEVRDEEGRWVDVPLPPGLRSIVLLNTPTYAGGRRLWGKDPKKPKKPRKWECVSVRQSLDDGLFEIIGVYSTFHLGRIMIELDRGVRIAQVNEARLTFRTSVHAQADGEPYRDLPGTYHIRPLKPQTMMTRPEKMVKT